MKLPARPELEKFNRFILGEPGLVKTEDSNFNIVLFH